MICCDIMFKSAEFDPDLSFCVCQVVYWKYWILHKLVSVLSACWMQNVMHANISSKIDIVLPLQPDLQKLIFADNKFFCWIVWELLKSISILRRWGHVCYSPVPLAKFHLQFSFHFTFFSFISQVENYSAEVFQLVFA